MATNIPLLSFNSGELSSLVDARADIDKYSSGCRILENFIPRIYGGVEKRPGTKFVHETKLSPLGVRLIPFIFNSEIAYMCEFGHFYARFYFNKTILRNISEDIVEIETPYLVQDLHEIQYKQLADTMWMVHRDYAPRKLTRTDVYTFSLDTIVFTKGPFRLRNDLLNDDDITMQCDVTDVDDRGLLIASGDVFVAGHVGALFKLTYPTATTQVSLELVSNNKDISDTLSVPKGLFRFRTHGRWKGTVKLQRRENSDLSTDWEDFRVIRSVNDFNDQYTDTEEEDNVEYRINMNDDHTSGPMTAELETKETLQEGIVRIDIVNSPREADITVITELVIADTTTYKWSEGAWSAYRGFPEALTFFEDRCVYARDREVWFSKTGDYENFEEDVKDADSFVIPLTTTNEAKWIEALDSLILGTSGNEFRIFANKLGTPLAPTNWTERQHSEYGSAAIQALKVNEVILFIDFVNRKIREFTWNDAEQKYMAPDLTALAEHITKTGITEYCHQKNPDSIVWCKRRDGIVPSMCYERDQNIIAWSRHLFATGSADTSGIGVNSGGGLIDRIEKYTKTFISENGQVWGVPIDYTTRTTLTLDDEGVARNIGGGLVGLPATGHPFTGGDTIRIVGTDNYDAQEVLDSTTTANELVITASYVAEEFDKSETIVQFIDLDSSTGRMIHDTTGNLYYGHALNTSGDPDNYFITKIEPDGTLSPDHEWLTKAWATSGTSEVRGLAITVAEDFLYIWIARTVDAVTAGQMHKFNLSTGIEVWESSETTAPGYDMAIDMQGNAYAPTQLDAVHNVISKFDFSDGSKTDLTLMGQAGTGASAAAHVTSGLSYAVIVDDSLGIVIAGGVQQSAVGFDNASVLYNLAVRTFDDSKGGQIAVGGTFNTGGGSPQDKTPTINTSNIAVYNGYIYVLIITAVAVATRLYKIRWNGSSLSIVKQVEGPQYGVGLYIDYNGQIVVINQDNATVQTDIFWFYDSDDLAFISKIDNFYTIMLGTWAAGDLNWQQGNACLYPGIMPYMTSYTFDYLQVPDTSAGGTITSIACMPGPDEDEVWLSMVLSIEGLLRRYICVMAARNFGDDLDDAFFVDCGLTYDGVATSTITGLDHLEGETVKVLADGAVFDEATVASGSITLALDGTTTTASTVQVGLLYTSKLIPMRPDVSGPGGTTQGSTVTVKEMGISFFDTINAQYGDSTSNLYDIDWTNVKWANSSDITGLFTGVVVVAVDGGFTIENNILISSSDPVPCTVRALIPHLDKMGR